MPILRRIGCPGGVWVGWRVSEALAGFVTSLAVVLWLGLRTATSGAGCGYSRHFYLAVGRSSCVNCPNRLELRKLVRDISM